MESILASRSLGEESVQMWELNKRLEAYLSRVKSLEEENGLLKSEIQNLRSSPLEVSCWRGHYEEEVASMRAALDQAFREKHAAELAREALHDQVRQVKGQCQKERVAREEAKRLLAAGKKQLEEERRAVLWLQKKATQLEKEAQGLVEVHREELAGLEREAGGFSRSFEEGFRVVAPPGCFQPREVEDYAQQLSTIWQGAVETYKRGVSQAEASLGQAKEELRRASQGNRESQLQLQQLEAELTDLTGRKEALEESLSHQGQLLQGEAEKLQLAVESLEEEKHSLQAQIAQVLEERQQLMHLKMSLSLEVATYRTLLEAESTRLQMPTTMDFKLPAGLKDLRADGNGGKAQVGCLGSRDSRPSPAAFPKANTKPWSPRNMMETSFVASPASLISKSRSPVAREFQKANTVLQSQSTKAFNVALTTQEEAPTCVDSPTFKLGASQQSQVVTATRIESVSQSFFHESSPAFDSTSPNIPYVLEEPGSNVKEEGEDREETAFDVEMKDKEGIVEDEKQPSDEPPGKAFSQNAMVTETSEMAIKDVNRGELLLEPSLLGTTGTHNGFPSIDSSTMEEENNAVLVPNRKDVDAVEKLHKDLVGDEQRADWQEDVEGFEATTETNGSQVVHQEEERKLSQKVGPPLLLEPSLLGTTGTHNGFPSIDSSTMEEENNAVLVPDRKEVDDTEKLHKDWAGDGQREDWQEDIEGFEATTETNGSQVVHQEEEREMSQKEGPLETGLLEEEGIGEQSVSDTPVAGEMERNEGGEATVETNGSQVVHVEHQEEEREMFQKVGPLETGLLEEEGIAEQSVSDTPIAGEMEKNEGGEEEHLLTFQADESEEVSECTAPANLEKEMPTKEDTEPFTSHGDDPIGAIGGSLEEMEGGTEDLEVVSTEALHLSEDEERRELWNEEYDLQGETLGNEFREAEVEVAAGNSSLLSRMTLPPEGHQEEQEALEKPKTPLCQMEEGTILAAEDVGAEDENSPRKDENALPKMTDSRKAEEEEVGQEGEDLSRHRDLCEEENDLGNKDSTGKEVFSDMGAVGLQDDAFEPEVTLQHEENVLEQEIFTGGVEEDIPQEKMEEEEASLEADGCILEGDELQRGAEVTEAESEEAAGTLEMEEITGHISPHNLKELGKDTEGFEAEQATSEAEDEQHVVFGEEEATQDQETTILEPSSIPDATWEAEVPSEVQNDSLHGCESTSHMDTRDFQPQSDSLESEESLESSDTSPNATHEGDGIEKELENGRQIMLEETLPDHTPLRAYEEKMLPITRESQPFSEGKVTAEPSPETTDGSEFVKEETQQVLEEESPSSPPPEGNDKEQERIKDKDSGHMEPDVDESAAKDSEETKMETAEVLQQNQSPCATTTLELSGTEEDFVHDPGLLEVESEKQAEERSTKQGGNVEKELVEKTPEEDTGEDFAWEPKKDSFFQADPFDPGCSEGIIPVEDDSSMSDQENMDTQRPHKDSPLTSVADLGEIVLEEERPVGQDKETESKDLECVEMVPDVHESHQIFEPESCGMEDHAQEVIPTGEAAVSILADDMKDSDIMEIVEQAHNLKDLDILEIVEQALEFNQERIKAEQRAEAGPPFMGGDTYSFSEEKSFSASVTSSAQIVTEPESPSRKAKNPIEPTHLWAESNTNGLQEEPNFANFPEEILNGLPNSTEGNVSTSGEDRSKKVVIPEEFTREDTEDDLLKVETVSHNPPSIEEIQRAGDVGSEIHEKAFLDHQGREALDSPQSIFAEILQTSRGKERELEGENPIGPSFGGDLLHLQPSQRLKFRPEEEEEPWSSEDNGDDTRSNH
nr:PREDICTED: nestin [Anolis carolinensis]|eukprot:XP_008120236.2 PREDICTED: nestin [Anolis carolinensis]